ncbi:MAG: hypothetical protein WCL61_01005 [bacterium]
MRKTRHEDDPRFLINDQHLGPEQLVAMLVKFLENVNVRHLPIGKVHVPPCSEGDSCAIIVPKAQSREVVARSLLYYLDLIFIGDFLDRHWHHQRSALHMGAYVIWVKDDDIGDMSGVTASNLRGHNIDGLDALEYLMFLARFKAETGRLPDNGVWHLCIDTIDRQGRSPAYKVDGKKFLVKMIGSDEVSDSDDVVIRTTC